jgi:hypothetical protein
MTDQATFMRIAELERKLTHLYQQLGIPEPGLSYDGFAPGVVEAVRAGNMIEAIKLHRQNTGMDLASAKRAVESLTVT